MTQPADRDAVQFTRESATRIANVVRTVEIGVPKLRPLVFDRVVRDGGDSGKVFRVATFTGAWQIGTLKAVTFAYQTATPNTVAVTNLFFPYPNNGAQNCAIARDGTAWFLVDVVFSVGVITYVQSIASATAAYVQSVATSNTTLTYMTGGSAELNTGTCQIVFTPETATATIMVAVLATTATTRILTSAPVTATAAYLRF